MSPLQTALLEQVIAQLRGAAAPKGGRVEGGGTDGEGGRADGEYPDRPPGALDGEAGFATRALRLSSGAGRPEFADQERPDRSSEGAGRSTARAEARGEDAHAEGGIWQVEAQNAPPHQQGKRKPRQLARVTAKPGLSARCGAR